MHEIEKHKKERIKHRTRDELAIWGKTAAKTNHKYKYVSSYSVTFPKLEISSPILIISIYIPKSFYNLYR
jgi:hypothetical protein